MSIHVCKCVHNGVTEYHLRYPGMTETEAQNLADMINGGAIVPQPNEGGDYASAVQAAAGGFTQTAFE